MAWTFLMHDLKCYQENIYANGVMASAYICYLYTTMAIGDKYRQNIIDFFCFYLFWGTVKWYVWTDKIILAAILVQQHFNESQLEEVQMKRPCNHLQCSCLLTKKGSIPIWYIFEVLQISFFFVLE